LEVTARVPVRVLVADVVLPDGSGLELSAKLRATCPDLHALALSVYTTAADESAARRAGF
jgi:DNA-binding NarL/FixJ family response regulator